jgi:transposase
VRPAEIFVGVLGASSYTYAEAVWMRISVKMNSLTGRI